MLTIAEVFSNETADTRIALDIDAEWALVEEARTPEGRVRGGAFDELMWQYIPALRGLASSEYRRLGDTVTLDEIRSNVLLAFLDVVESAEHGQRLSSLLKTAVLRASDSAHSDTARTIPARVRTRYNAAMRAAGGSAELAASNAHIEDLSVEAFWAVHEAVTSWTSLDEDDAPDAVDATDAYAQAEAKLEVAIALTALPEGSFGEHARERIVIDMAYGLNGENSMSDEVIAETLRRAAIDATEAGDPMAEDMLVMSPRTVTRVHKTALDLMHGALCDGTDDRCHHDHAA